MPRAKTTRGRPKAVSCPSCGKKFCSETNVLQHLNQPTSACYGKSLYRDDLFDPPELGGSTVNLNNPSHRNNTNQIRQTEQDGLSDGDIEMVNPAFHNPTFEEDNDAAPHPSPNVRGNLWNEDFEMAGPGLHSSDELHPASDSSSQRRPGRYVENFEGCGQMYLGGKTFMDEFWGDRYAEPRKENLYYPWASKEEWAFASWLIRSRLSMTAIDSLLSLDIIRTASLSFRSARELRARAESLPPGPKWLCETLKPEHPTKQPLRLFYRNPIDCLQALLSDPLLEPHIGFVPRKIWTCAAKLCRVYDEWLSGDRAWSIQEALPPGATVLGVVLSSDKTNISIMSGNRVAHPLLISLANIDAQIRSKASLHAYQLLALLPIAKFTHKNSRVRSLLQDRLVHHALDIVLSLLKTAAKVGVMMNDPTGNLRYCFTPVASYIADTPEECLLAAVSPKASPVTTATSKQFGDPFRHSSRTGLNTLYAIRTACLKYSPTDYKNFLGFVKTLCLNGVVEPFWVDWPLSDPSDFITIEPLHHFHRFAWDHDIKWCIVGAGAMELDFRFSLVQTPVGYRSFDEGISKLSQVTGRDHRAIQRYIIGVVAGSVPRQFLIAVRALLDFRYLAQAPVFTTDSLDRLSSALQEFHCNKDAVTRQGLRDGWGIPKLELLQSIVPGIVQSGAVMQWSADITEHAHVEDIKIPARAGNNQNYYTQIARHLDRLDRCFRFDLATYMEERRRHGDSAGFTDDHEDTDDHEPEPESHSFADYRAPRRPTIDYFSISSTLLQGSVGSVPRPLRTFATGTTAFHLANKPSSRLTVAETATTYELPDFAAALSNFFSQRDDVPRFSGDLKLQIWHKIRVQQKSFHNNDIIEPPQTLHAIPPSSTNSFGQYDSVIVSDESESDWPRRGLVGHAVVQLRVVFRPLPSDHFFAYVQRFNVASQSGHRRESPVTGMHLLKRGVRSDGQRVGEVIPLTVIRSPAHLIPNFGAEAHSRLTKLNSYEFSSEFWLNKYWSKEFYYALSGS